MPNSFFVLALFTAVATLTAFPRQAHATEPPSIVVVTLPIPPDPVCPVHVGIRVPTTTLTIPDALRTRLSSALYSSESVTLWVGGQLAHHPRYMNAALPLTLGELHEIDTNHGWHPGPTHSLFACLDRLPEDKAPILLGAPVPLPLGLHYDPARLLIEASPLPHLPAPPVGR